MDKLKYIKIENEDGSLSDNIPLGVDAENVDVTSAGGSQNLADYISVNDGKINSINSQIDDLQDSDTSLSNQIKSLSSGSPKGSYATVSALKSANPETGVYIIQEDGHIYSWTKNGNDAIDLGVYQATDIADNSVDWRKFNDSASSLSNINNCWITGFTDGYPKITIDIDNYTISINSFIIYNNLGFFRIENSSLNWYNLEDVVGSNTYFIYYDMTDNSLRLTPMARRITFKYTGSNNKVILGLIYLDNLKNLRRVNFPEMLQPYIYDANDTLFYTNNSEIAAPMHYSNWMRSYIYNNRMGLRNDISGIVNNHAFAFDISSPSRFKINYKKNEKKFILNYDSSQDPTYFYLDKGWYFALNDEYNGLEFDATNFVNTSFILFLDYTNKELVALASGSLSSDGEGAKRWYTNKYIALAEIWLIASGYRRVTPFSPQFDTCFYQDDVSYTVSRPWNTTSPSPEPEEANIPIELYNISDIGHLDKQDIGSTDYSHIILYGQSLSMGWECPEVITTEPVENCYMIGSSPMINHGNDQSLSLNPLKAVKWASGGEQPVVALTNSFATLYNDNHSVPQKFIGTNCGEGGKSIERLMKQCTNGTNYYTTEFLDTINSAKSAVDTIDKTISCPAIFFMQGEYNYVSLTGAGLEPDTDATSDKDQYKQYLMQLKNDMQADIMEKYGQSKKPLFFIYQVAGTYINRKDMSITMAQIEFAEENDDVFLMNSTYGMPDYNGGHLSTNGYRWYGEMMAKSMYQVFENRKQWNGLELANIQIDGKKVLCDFRVPVLPLVFDTWTKEERTNNGFRVFKDDSEITIEDISIEENRVIITTNTELTGTIEVTYAGQGPTGSGNLRDSDTFNSMYTYYDDRESAPNKRENYTPKDKDGNYIYGKKYPMYNWANHFYKKITVS